MPPTLTPTPNALGILRAYLLQTAFWEQFYAVDTMILTPLLQVRKHNIQRGKVTSLRRLSSSKGIHSYAGLMLLLMAFVGSFSDRGMVVVRQENMFPLSEPHSWGGEGWLPPNTQVSGHSDCSIGLPWLKLAENATYNGNVQG